MEATSSIPQMAPNGLNYLMNGPDNGDWVVFSNSLGANLSMWDELVPLLTNAGFRILRYDTRGHGQTKTVPAEISIASLSEDALTLLEYLNIHQAHLVGLSLGGMTFQHLASSSPKNLDILSLTLIATSAHTPPPESWRQRAQTVRQQGLETIVDAVLDRWFSKQAPQNLYDHWRRQFLTADPQGYAKCCEALANMDLRPALPNISAQTLIVAADEDMATPLEHSQVLQKNIPEAHLSIINEAAHLVAIEKPEETATVIMDNIKRSK